MLGKYFENASAEPKYNLYLKSHFGRKKLTRTCVLWVTIMFEIPYNSDRFDIDTTLKAGVLG